MTGALSMRMAISVLHHFQMTPDGTVYAYSNFDYTFYQRYLEVFDEVWVFARLEHIPGAGPATMPAKASGSGVRFYPIPEFLGPWQYVPLYPRIRARAKELLRETQAVVLRVPSYLSTILWHEMRKEKRPYAVEVVGDPWEAAAPGSVRSVLRPFLRAKWTWDQKRQCRDASVAAYVTERALQRRYPPGGWSTHYPSVELPGEFIINEARIRERLQRIDAKIQTGGPWRLCLVGSLWHLCKSPDVLLDAIADCTRKGLKLELVIVGGGSHEPELQARAHRLGLGDQVTFAGHLPPGRAVNDQLDQSDLFVLPSRSEGLPRVIIEAMARGLPCIGSAVGGIPELLESKHLVRPGDMRSLADAITKLVSDAADMKNAVRRNVAKAAEFRADVLQARRVELYRRLRDVTEAWLRRR